MCIFLSYLILPACKWLVSSAVNALNKNCGNSGLTHPTIRVFMCVCLLYVTFIIVAERLNASSWFLDIRVITEHSYFVLEVRIRPWKRKPLRVWMMVVVTRLQF